MANINKIRLSGQTYNIEDSNAPKTAELTQAQYDALAVKDPNTFYVITDAQGADLSNYYTKSETSGATEISTALASKQTTLTAGTNITIVDNVISATGGGGKAIEAGRGISITTGETADTVSFNLPISAGTGTDSIIGCSINNTASKSNSVALGSFNKASGDSSMAVNDYNVAGGQWSFAGGSGTKALGAASTSFGYSTNANKDYSFAVGKHNNANNVASFACGVSNISSSASTTFGHSGNTLFSVGNGGQGYYSGNRHNAFEIRENGDIYIADTNDTETTYEYEKPMIKLQDALGGGGTSYSAGTGIDITNDVISVTGKQDTLISGTNIKTINNESILGSGNISIQGGVIIDPSLDSGSTNPVANSAITQVLSEKQDTLSAGTGISIVDNVISATGGGGGTSYSAGTGIEITNDVISVSGVVMSSEVTSAVTSGSTDVVTSGGVYDQLGGMKIVKLTESEYAALVTKYDDTLYCVVPDPSN